MNIGKDTYNMTLELYAETRDSEIKKLTDELAFCKKCAHSIHRLKFRSSEHSDYDLDDSNKAILESILAEPDGYEQIIYAMNCLDVGWQVDLVVYLNDVLPPFMYELISRMNLDQRTAFFIHHGWFMLMDVFFDHDFEDGELQLIFNILTETRDYSKIDDGTSKEIITPLVISDAVQRAHYVCNNMFRHSKLPEDETYFPGSPELSLREARAIAFTLCASPILISPFFRASLHIFADKKVNYLRQVHNMIGIPALRLYIDEEIFQRDSQIRDRDGFCHNAPCGVCETDLHTRNFHSRLAFDYFLAWQAAWTFASAIISKNSPASEFASDINLISYMARLLLPDICPEVI